MIKYLTRVVCVGFLFGSISAALSEDSEIESVNQSLSTELFEVMDSKQVDRSPSIVSPAAPITIRESDETGFPGSMRISEAEED